MAVVGGLGRQSSKASGTYQVREMLRHLRHASWHCRRLAPRCLAAEFALEFACRAIPRIRSKGGPPPVAGAHACLLRRDPRLPLQTQCQTLLRRPRCRDRFARHDESVLREPPPPRCALQRFSALPARLETDRDLCPSGPAQEPLDEQNCTRRLCCNENSLQKLRSVVTSPSVSSLDG